jgi:hypothetical protein
MAKHLVEIDPELLKQARAAAGTATIKATVEAGLRKLASSNAVSEHIRMLRKHPLDRDALAKARAPRIPNRG